MAKVGRPRATPNKRRLHVVPIRLSPSELTAARRQAEVEGLTISAVVRRALRRDLTWEQDQPAVANDD